MMSSNPGGYYHQTNAGYYGNSGMHTGATTANGVSTSFLRDLLLALREMKVSHEELESLTAP